MNKFILIWFVLSLLLFIVWLNKLYSCINFKFDIDRLDFSTLKLSDVSKSNVTVRLKTLVCIDNCNNVNFSFKDFKLYLYYKNLLVANTSEIQENSKSIYIKKKSNTCFNEFLDLIINASLIESVALIKLGKPVDFNYVFKIRFLGIPISYKGIYTYTP